jgi:hypothetical protein
VVAQLAEIYTGWMDSVGVAGVESKILFSVLIIHSNSLYKKIRNNFSIIPYDGNTVIFK